MALMKKGSQDLFYIVVLFTDLKIVKIKGKKNIPQKGLINPLLPELVKLSPTAIYMSKWRSPGLYE